MKNATDIAAQILALPYRHVKPRLFGWYLDRPLEDIYNLVGADADGEMLTLTFSKGETLRVWNPSGFSKAGRGKFLFFNFGTCVIRIDKADHVRWECYEYGREQSADYLQFLDFLKQGDENSVTGTRVRGTITTPIRNPAIQLDLY